MFRLFVVSVDQVAVNVKTRSVDLVILRIKQESKKLKINCVQVNWDSKDNCGI